MEIIGVYCSLQYLIKIQRLGFIIWSPPKPSLVCQPTLQPEFQPDICNLDPFGEARLTCNKKWPKLRDLEEMPIAHKIKLCGVCWK